MRYFCSIIGALVFFTWSAAQAHAEAVSVFERELAAHFAGHVAYEVDRIVYPELPEVERTAILDARDRFDKALREQGLYAAHLIWISELGTLLGPNDPSADWNQIPRMTEHQYQEVIKRVGEARDRTQQSGEMMENGRRTVHDYYFRPLEDRRLDYWLVQIVALMTRDTEQLKVGTANWVKMVGVDDLAAIEPPIQTINEMQEMIARTDAAVTAREASEADLAASEAGARESERLKNSILNALGLEE